LLDHGGDPGTAPHPGGLVRRIAEIRSGSAPHLDGPASRVRPNPSMTSQQEAALTELNLELAQSIITAALKAAREKNLKPLSVVVYDARGALRALASEDGTSLKRAEIAMGKAYGSLSLGVGSRAIHKMAVDRPYFVAAATHSVGGQLIPAPGGVLIKDAQGRILGAVGISGDTSDNDEMAAAAGIESVGLVFDAGA
jgi:uncharacterized protein GlcG (DUF336 family)